MLLCLTLYRFGLFFSVWGLDSFCCHLLHVFWFSGVSSFIWQGDSVCDESGSSLIQVVLLLIKSRFRLGLCVLFLVKWGVLTCRCLLLFPIIEFSLSEFWAYSMPSCCTVWEDFSIDNLWLHASLFIIIAYRVSQGINQVFFCWFCYCVRQSLAKLIVWTAGLERGRGASFIQAEAGQMIWPWREIPYQWNRTRCRCGC